MLVLPPEPAGYVLDQANILSDATEAQLGTELTQLDQDTSTQMVVVTVDSLQGYEPEQYALQIGREWGVGQKDTDNGVVFLIAPTEHAARIEVGYGLEGAITDAQSYQILNDVALPRFAEGNYDQGTLDTMADLETLARGEPFTAPTTSSTSSVDPWQFLPYGLIFLWVLLSWMSQSKSWWLGGIFGGALGTLAGFLTSGGVVLGLILGIGLGLGLDYIVSKYFFGKIGGRGGPGGGIFFGGGRGGFGGGSGGGFGGFGGGGFGGGGASGRW